MKDGSRKPTAAGVVEQDIDEQWSLLTLRAVEKLGAAKHDVARLTESEQELAVLWRLEADMNNGGFIQFFCNGGENHYRIALRALEKIGADTMRRIIAEQYTIIERLRDAPQIETLWDIPKFLTEQETDELARLDRRFSDYPDNIASLGLAYYSLAARIRGE